MRARFDNTANDMKSIVKLILKNDNIKKYIYYLDEKKHPLDKTNKKVSTAKINNEHIYLTVFNENLVDSNKVMLFFNPIKMDFGGTDLSANHYQIDIVVPNKYWVIGNVDELRAYSIADEISKSIDGKHITGVGRVKILEGFVQPLVRKHTILSIIIKTTFSMKTPMEDKR